MPWLTGKPTVGNVHCGGTEMGLMNEQTACQIAVQDLRKVEAMVNAILADLYDSAPAYAGEVESVKEAVTIAMRVLRGEPVD